MKRFRGIYWSQFTLTAGLVLLTLVLLGTSFFTLSYTYLMSEKQQELREKAQMVADLTHTYANDGSLSDIFGGRNEGLQIIAQVAASISDIDFLIWDTGSNTMLTTDDALEGREISLPASVTRRVLAGRTYSGMTDLNIYPSRKYVVGVPISAASPMGTEVRGMVLAVTEADSLTVMWRAFLIIFTMTAITVILIAFVASSVAAMRQTRPIKEMAVAARRFAGGDFDIRVNTAGRDDEIGELAEAFNAMAESLQQTEQQRREFIANVSHELKTPMTSISGYAEGILDGTIPREQADHYLRIISDESRRLNRLVRRMLEVSRIQSRSILQEKAPFDIGESMRRALISLEKKITDRNLDVEADIPDEPFLVLGDRDLITQVIYNLLENAAKFATPGTTLYLGIRTQGEKAEVSVRNVGDTIPPEEIPRLFERFHKTDKSRSEDKDGVGLGLYIVKTILDQHQEQLRATSENGVTTFSFTMTMAGESGKTVHER